MDDPLLVRRLEGFGDLCRDRQGFIDRDRTTRDSLREVLSLDERVDQLMADGRPGEAIPLAERSVQLKERHFGPKDRVVAVGLHNLAFLYKEHGQPEPARAALARADEAMACDAPERGPLLVTWAEIELLRGRPYEAQALAAVQSELTHAKARVQVSESQGEADLARARKQAEQAVVGADADLARSRRQAEQTVLIAEADARKYLEMGMTYVAVGGDSGLLRGAAVALAQKFKPKA